MRGVLLGRDTDEREQEIEKEIRVAWRLRLFALFLLILLSFLLLFVLTFLGVNLDRNIDLILASLYNGLILHLVASVLFLLHVLDLSLIVIAFEINIFVVVFFVVPAG